MSRNLTAQDQAILRRVAASLPAGSPGRAVLAGLGFEAKQASLDFNTPGVHILGKAQVSQNGRVSDRAQVYENARVRGSATVGGWAKVSGKAEVRGKSAVFMYAHVYGNAQVFGEALITDKAKVFGDARVLGEAEVTEHAQVSGEAEVGGWAQVYGKAQVLGKAKLLRGARIGGTSIILGGIWDGTEGEILSGSWLSPGVSAGSAKHVASYDWDTRARDGGDDEEDPRESLSVADVADAIFVQSGRRGGDFVSREDLRGIAMKELGRFGHRERDVDFLLDRAIKSMVRDRDLIPHNDAYLGEGYKFPR